MCQKKDSPPSAPSALLQANFGEGSLTSGSLHLSFNGGGLKLGSLHIFFSCASLKLGFLCTFSSMVQASRWVLLLPELWACKSTEEEQSLEAAANLSSVLPPRLYLILLYFSFDYVVSFRSQHLFCTASSALSYSLVSFLSIM